MSERQDIAAALRAYAGTPTSEWSDWEYGWHKGLLKAAELVENGDT